MKINGIAFVLIALFLFFFAGCAEITVARIDGRDVDLAWPRPPLKAKIKFVASVSGIETRGFSKNKGFFSESWDKITGQSLEVRSFLAPYSVTVDEKGILYVVDRDRGEVISIDMDEEASFIFRYFPDEGNYAGEDKDYPVGIAVAKDNIYVTYPRSGKIRIFSKLGELKKEIGEGGGLKRPTGIAVNEAKDRLYVSDTTDHNIKIFNLNGDFITLFGGRGTEAGKFNYPTHIFIGKDEKIYVNDELNFRIQLFSKDGEFLFKFGQGGQVAGTLQLSRGVAADSHGNIYVADYAADYVQVFDQQGALLIVFGGSGDGLGRFGGPSGMFIDREDRIFIADIYNKRIQVFKFTGNE
ncbi:MAG: 6-bladed beta-propeller [Deltaproteobacteria bacterium]|nr:6-bladed beta-propeller [Deltaproteobacteria bacterium]